MVRIQYKESIHYQWTKEFLQLCSGLGISPKLYPKTQELEIEHDQIELLFRRISNPLQVAILPSIPEKPEHRWLVVGPDLQSLERAVNRIRHFIIPTYAVFADGPIPIFHSFTKEDRPLFKLAAQVYPDGGYCVLKSRSKDIQHLLQRLNTWLQLEESRPAPQLEDIPPTYAALYERFRLALATAQWEESEEIRRIIQCAHLTSADNLLFLEIEQWAHQHRWQDIRDHEDFQQLTRTRIPRNIRGALLTAFHQTSSLLDLEQQGKWKDALETFRQSLPELGLLLTGRYELTQGPVLQMFAYQFAIEKKRGALLDLIEVNNDPDALQCIKQLLHLLGKEFSTSEPIPSNSTPFSMVMEALNDSNFDLAQKQTLAIGDEQLKIALLMNIAFLSSDLTQASEVLFRFHDLIPAERDAIRGRFPVLSTIEKSLHDWTAQTLIEEPLRTSVAEKKIIDWLDWFAYLSHTPNDPILVSSQENLINDERFWSIERIQELNDHFLLFEEDTKRLPCVRDALQKLLSYFLSDDASFPREDAIYQDLYEILYTTLLAKTAQEEMKNNSQVLLRLAHTMLSNSPNKVETVFQELQKWGGKPISRLEMWALEAFEMLIDYGIEPGLLADWYREWAEQVIYRQTRYELAQVEGWLEFGRIIQPGDDLLRRLQEKITTIVVEKDIKDPIKSLSDGFCITIYTLQEPAAHRATDLLLKRNSSLNISICTDKVLTEPAKALAQKSDAVVMVTTAMKHALSYGLDRYLTKEKTVYPQSCGSTSIVRAIEDLAKRASNL